MTALPEQFISCDWGTTNFRLKLVEANSLQVLAEHQTDQGIRVMNQGFLDHAETDRVLFFANYLKQQLPELPLRNSHYQIVISGMASSNLGLQELPYADMPFDQSGAGLKWQNIVSQNGLELLLISGVKSESGIMRGEEIQAIGLEQQLKLFDKGILILPGTHSKHLTFEQGKFTSLKTFMTGEIFELMSKQSIVVNSVASSKWGPSRESAFISGLNTGLKGGLTANLFSIRADHVINNTSKEDNFYKLSGMIIGDELGYLQGHETNVVLAAPDPVLTLYQTALKQIILSQQLEILDKKDLERALLMGQKKIMELNAK